jgi:hypothetical protein
MRKTHHLDLDGEKYANTLVPRGLVAALLSLIEGKVFLTEGVQEVLHWRNSNHGLPDALFDPLSEVDSETHMFPVGAVRLEWHKTALAREDEDRKVVEKFYREYALHEATVLYEAALAKLPDSTFNLESRLRGG